MADKSNASFTEQGDDMVHDLFRGIITQSHALDSDKVSNALLFFLVRVANTWRSIRTLQKHTGDSEGFMVDAGSLLRAMYDAYMQAQYLVSKPTKSQDRAHDYFDFEHIERHKAIQRMLTASNWIAKRLQGSPKRKKGEKENEQLYNAVKERFRIKSKGNKSRTQWYPGNLRQIADSSGMVDEV